MSEYADKHSKSERKARVEHILSSTKGKIDASGYEVPGELHAEEKTGPCKPKPRAYAKGGAVEGHKAHHHAGRKSRDAGGPTAVEQLRPQVPTGGLYGSGFSPTHAGMLSNAAGLKKGGEAKKRYKRADGGDVDDRNRSKNEGDFRPLSPRDFGDSPAYRGRPGTKMTQTGIGGIRGGPEEGLIGINDPRPPDPRQASDALMEKMQDLAKKRGGAVKKRACGGKAGERRLEMAKAESAKHRADGGGIANEVTGVRVTGGRKARAEGGRAKGKTNINIIIGAPKDQDQPPMVPPPPSAMPPKPPMGAPSGLPPAAMGAMSGPGMGGAPSGPMPPQLPAGMVPR